MHYARNNSLCEYGDRHFEHNRSRLKLGLLYFRFKKGLKKLHGLSTEKIQLKYARCIKYAFEAPVNKHSVIFTFFDVDGTETNVRPLRPSGKEAGVF